MKALEVSLTEVNADKDRQQPISKGLIHEVLVAAMNSPSAGNAQPWHFVVITDIDILSSVAAISPHAVMIKQALAAIIVCGDLKLEKMVDSWVRDCSAAVQTLLLATQAKGMCAVWTGIYPDKAKMDALRRLLHLPQHILPHTLVPLGYPTENVTGNGEARVEKIHYNSW